MTGEHSSGVERVAVVGAGLVGALEACLLAQRGFKVILIKSMDSAGLVRALEACLLAQRGFKVILIKSMDSAGLVRALETCLLA